MKELILAMLLMIGLLVTAPTASACSVFEDPTGLTPTCVDEYEDGHGDETCESSGAHTKGTTATTSVPGIGSVHADHSESCFNDGSGDASHGLNTQVVVTPEGLPSVTITLSLS